MFGLFRRRPAPEAEDAAEPVASSRPAERIGADGLTVGESMAHRWLDLGQPDLDGAIADAVAKVVRVHGGGTDGKVTAPEIAERISATAVSYVRVRAKVGTRPDRPIDRATIAADPALAAFFAAVQGDNNPWPRLRSEAATNRWGAVKRWRQIGAGLLLSAS